MSLNVTQTNTGKNADKFRAVSVTFHRVTARPQVADWGEGFQIWRVAAKMLNKQSRIAEECERKFTVL
jgi:hypothetical protein